MQEKCPIARSVLYRSVVLATGLLAGAASAGLHDTSYPIGATPGTWQQDRYAPAVFANGGTVAGRSDVLNLGVAVADSQANRPPAFASTFYNTQGRGLVLNLPNYAVVYGSLYIPAAWTTSSGPLVTVPASEASASVASTTVMTDRFGVATVAATANGNLGEFTVSATAPGLEVAAAQCGVAAAAAAGHPALKMV